MPRQCQPCATLQQAEALAAEKEQMGYTSVSVLFNAPTAGVYGVYWGMFEESSIFDDPMRLLARCYAERDAQDERDFTKRCEGLGRALAAEEFASALGLTGVERQFYEAGFSGTDAKIVRPKEHGMNAIFRAGRNDWGSAAGQKAWRRHSVAARSIVVKVAQPSIGFRAPHNEHN